MGQKEEHSGSERAQWVRKRSAKGQKEECSRPER